MCLITPFFSVYDIMYKGVPSLFNSTRHVRALNCYLFILVKSDLVTEFEIESGNKIKNAAVVVP